MSAACLHIVKKHVSVINNSLAILKSIGTSNSHYFGVILEKHRRREWVKSPSVDKQILAPEERIVFLHHLELGRKLQHVCN